MTTSKVFRDLASADKFPDGEENIRYLTAEDLQILSMKVTENYVATVTTGAQYVPTQQSVSVAELIYSRLARYSYPLIYHQIIYCIQKTVNEMPFKTIHRMIDNFVILVYESIHINKFNTTLKCFEVY